MRAGILSVFGLVFVCACGAGQNVKSDSTASASVKSGETMQSAKRMVSLTEEEPEPEKKIDETPVLNKSSKCDASVKISDELCETSESTGSCLKMDIDTLHELGKQKINEKKSQAALTILRSALSKDKSNNLIRSDYAVALLGCGLYPHAVLEYEKAHKALPDHIDIAFNLAQAYLIIGRLDLSVETYLKAVELAPEDAEIRNNLAVALVAAGDLEEAEVQVRKAIKLEPESSEYMVDLGAILSRQKRYNDAVIVLKRALLKDEKNAEIYNMLGFVMFLSGQSDKAAEYFRKALDIDPTHKGAKENLMSIDEKFDFDGPWQNK